MGMWRKLEIRKRETKNMLGTPPLSVDNGYSFCYTSVLYKVMVVFAYQFSWIIFSHSHFLLLPFSALPSLSVFVATIYQLHRVVYLVTTFARRRSPHTRF